MKTFIARPGNGLVAALCASVLITASGAVQAQNLTVAGTVAIGTTTPHVKLHVVGGAIAAQAGSAQFVELWHDNAIIYGSSGGCCGSLRFGKADDVTAAGWVEQMRLSVAGNLGIGTVSPATKLDVNGDVSVGGVNTIRRDGTNAHLFPWGTGYSGNNVYFGAGVGGIPVYASAFNQFSSARYKKNLSDSNYGLKEVLRLRAKRYQYKGSDKPEIGLIAEEVVEVVPEIVSLDRQGRPDAIDYSKLSTVLLQGLQDLKSENDRLSASNVQLARRISRLEEQRTSQRLRSDKGDLK
jgi:hypothetical protein